MLIAGAAGVALAQPVPISREMAEHIGNAERAERAKLVEAAHGRPVALPTPSPFLNENDVRSLPTQAQLDAHPELAPRGDSKYCQRDQLPKAVPAEVSAIYSRAPQRRTEAHNYMTEHPEEKNSTVRDYLMRGAGTIWARGRCIFAECV